MPRVSVLVATYNRASLLPESLESVLAQTVPPHQVIVINDGSTDDTRAAVKAYSGKILYLEQWPNGGKSAALNLGMQHVTGDYVWIMDDDDLALPDALERQLEILESRAEVGFTYTSHYQPEGGVFCPPDSYDPVFLIRLMRGHFFRPSGMLVRTSCLREVGPYDPELFRSEDYDMSLRLALRFQCARIDAPTFIVRYDFGPRGPSVDRFPFRKALLKAMEYDKKVFRKVRREFPLHCYLPKRPGPRDDSSLTPNERRRALFQRASIMASKDLHWEMAEDLYLASAIPMEDTLTLDERGILWDFEWCHDRLPPQFEQRRNREVLQNTAAISNSHALKSNRVAFEIKCDCARGLYWKAIRTWQASDRLHAVVLFFSACRLVGARGLPGIGFRKALGFRDDGPRPGIETTDSRKH